MSVKPRKTAKSVRLPRGEKKLDCLKKKNIAMAESKRDDKESAVMTF